MKQEEYNKLSVVTEKRFPDGLTLSDNTMLKMDMVMDKICNKSGFIDELKKDIIYKDHKDTDDSDFHYTQEQIELWHGAIGMLSEAIEINQAIWTWIKGGYGSKLDVVNVGEELGDNRWYEAMFLRKLGLDPADFMHTNIEKLKSRYGDKFSNNAAINRDLDTERDILEQ